MWWPFLARSKADPRIAALKEFAGRRAPSDGEAQDLLDLWGFAPPKEIVVFLVRRVTVRRHELLPEPEWTLTFEEGELLLEYKAERIVNTIVELARRIGVAV